MKSLRVRMALIGLAGALAACAVPVGNGQAADPPVAAAPAADPLARRVVALVNGHRAAAGLAPIAPEPRLRRAARDHAAAMATNGFVGHTGPDGADLAVRLDAAGYPYGTAAENVAAGFATPESVVDGWMESAGHRRNILDPRVREAGVGYVFVDGNDGYRSYWTLIMGTPRPASVGKQGEAGK